MDRVVWTDTALHNVRNIFLFICNDAPYRAAIFINELKESTDRLESFPRYGRIIPEKNNPDYRELLFGNYRIMYRIQDSLVEILQVYHSSRMFDPAALN
jgi:toxin ParE1/3/4